MGIETKKWACGLISRFYLRSFIYLFIFCATSQIMLQLPMGGEGAFKRQSTGWFARAEVELGYLNPQSNMLVFSPPPPSLILSTLASLFLLLMKLVSYSLKCIYLHKNFLKFSQHINPEEPY